MIIVRNKYVNNGEKSIGNPEELILSESGLKGATKGSVIRVIKVRIG